MRGVLLVLLALPFGLAIAACDTTTPLGKNPEPSETPVGACDGVYYTIEEESGVHVAAGTTIQWSTNPPATGRHYGAWAGWDRHYQNLDRGNYVHNAEHGGVILLYNCAPGAECPDVVDALLGAAREAAPDLTCTAPVTKRVIVARDLLLPAEVKVAAVAWNAYYTAGCFDPYVATFLAENYRGGPEDTCADGVPFGGVPIGP